MEITTWLSNFFNHPLVQTVVEIVTVAGGILAIISKTSLGKKALNKLAKLHEEKNAKLDETKKSLEDAENKYNNTINKVNELIVNKDAIIAEVKKEADAKYQLLYNDLNTKIIDLVDCLSHVNNEYIKNKVNSIIASESAVNISEIVEKAKLYDDLIKRVEALEDGKNINDYSEKE